MVGSKEANQLKARTFTMKHEIFCGSLETMQKVANRGVRALNPRTMKWNVINKKAKYNVVSSGVLTSLFSDIDLCKEAKERGLII